MKIRTIKIGELSDYISQSVNYDPILQNIYVEGEISNFKIHSTGNIYFTLKDENTKVRCILFSQSYKSIREFDDISDGNHVICRGSVNYYKKEGYISLVVEQIQQVGESQAYQEFLLLKEKLEKDGFFDMQYKKTLPPFPRKIGVVTSPTGAVIRDIYHVIKRRYPVVEILLFPAHVQGDGAVREIVDGINFLDKMDVDIIIIARGGGSYEELNAFNAQEVAQAIFRAETPIISAVGHETDFTISDFVADVRASTPSVAAEIAVPKMEDIKHIVEVKRLMMNELIQKMIFIKEDRLNYIKRILDAHTPEKLLHNTQDRIIIQKSRLNMALMNIINYKKKELEKRSVFIFSKNPQNIFDFGGALLYNRNGKQIESIQKVLPGMEFKIVMKDGEFTAKVVEM